MQCTYKIGTTGIDVATISFEVEKNDVESVLSLLKKRKNNGDSKIKNLSETNAVISLASHRFVCGYENKRHTPYATVEIHSALQDGDNLANLKMTELIDKYDVIAEELEMEYGISWMKNQKETAHFSRLELNITIETEYSFLTYLRFFKLLAYAVLKKGGVLSTFSTANSFKRAIEIETLKCDRPTYALRIYNKIREISQKLNCLPPTANLLRIEFLYKKTQTIKTDFGDRAFMQFSDEIIKRAFLSRFTKIMTKVNKYIREKLLLAPDHVGACDTVANVIARHCVDGLIADHAAILGEFSYYENYYGIPILFDTRDLGAAIKKLYVSQILTSQCSLDEHVHSFDGTINSMDYGRSVLQSQYMYAEEILNKIYHSKEYNVVLER